MEGKQKMSDSIQKGILGLLYSAVTGEAVTLPEGFDLEQAMPQINHHKIGNLAYYGAVNCGVDPKLPVMQKLFSVTYQCMLVDERQRKALQQLWAAFEANGIHYMPVKGALIKDIYPKSDMRTMGDADILIKMEQYDQIKTVMEQLGYEFIGEKSHELTWNHPNLHAELHRFLVPDYNVDFARYYGDCWHLGRPVGEDACRYEMTDEDHMIYLFTHFAKHYRNGGIGIRHMLDLYMFQKAKPSMDEGYIAGELKKLKLYDFYCNIFETLKVWFAGAEANQKTELITQRIFVSGVFGNNAARKIFEAVVDKEKTGDNAKQYQRKKWLWAIFLPYDNMCILYPVLKKVPVLLPFMWVARWLKILFTRSGVIKEHRNNLKALDQNKLDTWEAQMQEVGLSFDFEEKES